MQVKTIVITGPESTGKTTLCKQLAAHFNTQWIPEFARSYIDNLKRPYLKDDLLEIAKGQIDLEKKIIKKSSHPVFLDTSLEVIKIWSEYKYGTCDDWILEQLKNRKHFLYLLCQPDIQWEFDPQRESENNRQELFNIYQKELSQQNLNFVIVNGLGNKRLSNAIHYVESIFHITRSTDHAQ